MFKSIFEQYIDAYETFLRHVIQNEYIKENIKDNMLHNQVVTILCGHVSKLDEDYSYSLCDMPISISSERLMYYDTIYVKVLKYVTKIFNSDATYPKYMKYVNSHTLYREKMINRFSLVIDNIAITKMLEAITFYNNAVYIM